MFHLDQKNPSQNGNRLTSPNLFKQHPAPALCVSAVKYRTFETKKNKNKKKTPPLKRKLAKLFSIFFTRFLRISGLYKIQLYGDDSKPLPYMYSIYIQHCICPQWRIYTV